MSNKKVAGMDDCVIAAIRLALMNRPRYGTTGVSVIIHDNTIVRIETSRSEQFKLAEDINA